MVRPILYQEAEELIRRKKQQKLDEHGSDQEEQFRPSTKRKSKFK